MNIAQAFENRSLDEIKELLAGGSLTVYSVARPTTADRPVDRSTALATFTFASPAFGESADAPETALFAANPVPATSVGTPGFARVRTASGTVLGDLSAGPGDREIKFAEVCCSQGAPVCITQFSFKTEESWPERSDYYETRPRSGFPLPASL